MTHPRIDATQQKTMWLVRDSEEMLDRQEKP